MSPRSNHLKTIKHRTSKVQRPIEKPGARRVCLVTGTRAEFGLMRSTLEAIHAHPKLTLQIIATGMHLSAKHGRTVAAMRAEGWTVDATVPWQTGDQSKNAQQTGRAMAGIAAKLEQLQADIVLVVGDRVEAFAAAAAGHIAGRIVAHVHGGDRALGQVDDSLRHAITKLSHVHFPATAASRDRILKLGEDSWRVHLVGSPGTDGIANQAGSLQSSRKKLVFRYALVVLHPTGTDETIEQRRAKMVLGCVRQVGFDRIIIIYPNNDPGSAGIIRSWETDDGEVVVHRDVPRGGFLALMRDAAVLIGNSSSGIIEAASFGTPVVDIGPRQQGREHSSNLIHVPFHAKTIELALRRIWNNGKAIRYPKENVYGGDGAGRRIASVLASVRLDARLSGKLIAY